MTNCSSSTCWPLLVLMSVTLLGMFSISNSKSRYVLASSARSGLSVRRNHGTLWHAYICSRFFNRYLVVSSAATASCVAAALQRRGRLDLTALRCCRLSHMLLLVGPVAEPHACSWHVRAQLNSFCTRSQCCHLPNCALWLAVPGPRCAAATRTTS